jgi:hypothetical protein
MWSKAVRRDETRMITLGLKTDDLVKTKVQQNKRRGGGLGGQRCWDVETVRA